MLLAALAEASVDVAALSGRLAKIERLVACLRAASPDEAALAVSYLAGELPQGSIGIGWAALRALPPPAATPSLEILEVDRLVTDLAAVAGKGSRAKRSELVDALFARTTAAERALLLGLLGGELRQGALEGVMIEVIAKTAAVPAVEVRRAVMVTGALGVVVKAALGGGLAALLALRLEVLRPLRPMLAETADDVASALARSSPAAFEWKLDGARIQVHREGDVVRVFTRSLAEITDRVPEIVAAVGALPVTSIVLDGEAIALRADGSPHPFQTTMSRFGSRLDVDAMRASLPLSGFFFDCLSLDGEDLLAAPYSARIAAMERVLPASVRVPRLVTADPAEADAFLRDAIARRHEGVMAKALDATYDAGHRGAHWLKIKPAHTFDLVVLAAEWGHGRRAGKLSNLHLGARGEDGSFVMLGKTFKGMTDAILAWQTEKLLALETSRAGIVVHVRPELVVEVAIDGVQASSRYPGGVALRFARIKGYREDKRVEEIDTVASVRALLAR